MEPKDQPSNFNDSLRATSSEDELKGEEIKATSAARIDSTSSKTMSREKEDTFETEPFSNTDDEPASINTNPVGESPKYSPPESKTTASGQTVSVDKKLFKTNQETNILKELMKTTKSCIDQTDLSYAQSVPELNQTSTAKLKSPPVLAENVIAKKIKAAKSQESNHTNDKPSDVLQTKDFNQADASLAGSSDHNVMINKSNDEHTVTSSTNTKTEDAVCNDTNVLQTSPTEASKTIPLKPHDSPSPASEHQSPAAHASQLRSQGPDYTGSSDVKPTDVLKSEAISGSATQVAAGNIANPVKAGPSGTQVSQPSHPEPSQTKPPKTPESKPTTSDPEETAFKKVDANPDTAQNSTEPAIHINPTVDSATPAEIKAVQSTKTQSVNSTPVSDFPTPGATSKATDPPTSDGSKPASPCFVKNPIETEPLAAREKSLKFDAKQVEPETKQHNPKGKSSQKPAGLIKSKKKTPLPQYYQEKVFNKQNAKLDKKKKSTKHKSPNYVHNPVGEKLGSKIFTKPKLTADERNSIIAMDPVKSKHAKKHHHANKPTDGKAKQGDTTGEQHASGGTDTAKQQADNKTEDTASPTPKSADAKKKTKHGSNKDKKKSGK